jgi:hypothetical protein
MADRRAGKVPRVPEKGGGTQPRARADTQAEAIDRARQIVGKAGGGEVVIHRRDGRIRDSD